MVHLGQRVVSGVLCALVGVGSDSGGTIILNNGAVSSVGSGVRQSTFRLNADGYVYFVDNTTPTKQYQWEQTGGVPADFDAYVTSSDGLVSGTTGAWLNLGTTRDWTLVSAVIGDAVYDTLTIQIRKTSTGIVAATAIISLYAERY